MDITERLKKEVKKAAAKSSLYAVAKESGVDYAILHKWINGERNPSGETVNKLGRYFELELTKK